MLENLSKTDYIILFILALIIFIAGIVLVVFIKKSKKTTVLDKVLENEEQEEPKKIKKAEQSFDHPAFFKNLLFYLFIWNVFVHYGFLRGLL